MCTQIKPVWNPDGSHNFVLTDRRLSQQIRDGFRVNAANNEITFNRFSDVQRPDDRTALFFKLPPSFRGDLVSTAFISLRAGLHSQIQIPILKTSAVYNVVIWFSIGIGIRIRQCKQQ